MAAARPQYVPTGDEISDAISVALSGTQETPSAKELQKILEKENPTWKLPERRVAKFLKKELNKPDPDAVVDGDDPDESASQASLAKRAALVTRRSFSRLKKAGSKKSTTTTDLEGPKKETDDDEKSQSSIAKRAALATRKSLSKLVSKKKVNSSSETEKPKRAGRFASFRRKKKNKATTEDDGDAPPVVVTTEEATLDSKDTNLLSPVTVDGDAAEEEEEEEEELLPPPEVAAEEPATEAEVEEPTTEEAPEEAPRDVVYEDDNDGKKEQGLCTGCVIL